MSNARHNREDRTRYGEFAQRLALASFISLFWIFVCFTIDLTSEVDIIVTIADSLGQVASFGRVLVVVDTARSYGIPLPDKLVVHVTVMAINEAMALD